jgi:hypothetical protein
MPQMRSIQADAFAIFQATDIFPNHFIVSKAGPAMVSRFSQKILPSAAGTRFEYLEQWLARVAIIKYNGLLLFIEKKANLIKMSDGARILAPGGLGKRAGQSVATLYNFN